jgi:hypothetical protein
MTRVYPSVRTKGENPSLTVGVRSGGGDPSLTVGVRSGGGDPSLTVGVRKGVTDSAFGELSSFGRVQGFIMSLFEWIFRSLSLVLAVLAIACVAYGVFADRWRGLTRKPRCPKCWYDLSGAVSIHGEPSGTGESQGTETPPSRPALVNVGPCWLCAECGHVTKDERSLHKARKRWWVLVPAPVLLALGVLAWHWPTIDRDGWRAAVPTWVIVHLWPMDEMAWMRQSGGNGNEMLFELDRRMDTNLVSPDLLKAWAGRVERAYAGRSVAAEASTANRLVLARLDLGALLALSFPLEADAGFFLGEGDTNQWARMQQERQEFERASGPLCRSITSQLDFILVEERDIARRLITECVDRDTWIDNGGITGLIRYCGTELIIVGSEAAVNDALHLMKMLQVVVQRVTSGEVGARQTVLNRDGRCLVIYDVGDIEPLRAAAILWVEERTDEVRSRILEAIEVESWYDNGGDVGSIMMYGRLLLVQHTPETHEQINAFLATTRREQGQ